MNLTNVSHTTIQSVARDAGFSLTERQARHIAEVESDCLDERKRVSFGEHAAVRIVRAFAESPFIVGGDMAMPFVELVEAFYELREDFPATITDAQIVESLEEAFNGEAAGDASLAATLAGEALSKQLNCSIYEIADDEGNVYRWDPEEWRDDVTARGWCGECWEDAAE